MYREGKCLVNGGELMRHLPDLLLSDKLSEIKALQFQLNANIIKRGFIIL